MSSALRVPRAVTRLTVYRSSYISVCFSVRLFDGLLVGTRMGRSIVWLVGWSVGWFVHFFIRLFIFIGLRIWLFHRLLFLLVKVVVGRLVFCFGDAFVWKCSTSLPGGNQVDGLPPAPVVKYSGVIISSLLILKAAQKCIYI